MLSRNTRLLLVGLLALLFAAPALGMPGGPPWKNGDSLVVESGCSCHGDGVPSTEVVVSISGVPRSYTLDETYTFTVTLQHASNAARIPATATRHACGAWFGSDEIAFPFAQALE